MLSKYSLAETEYVMSGSSQPTDFARLFGLMFAKGVPVILCSHKFNLYFICGIMSNACSTERRISLVKWKRSYNEDKSGNVLVLGRCMYCRESAGAHPAANANTQSAPILPNLSLLHNIKLLSLLFRTVSQIKQEYL